MFDERTYSKTRSKRTYCPLVVKGKYVYGALQSVKGAVADGKKEREEECSAMQSRCY
jgi:hypothetical protein